MDDARIKEIRAMLRAACAYVVCLDQLGNDDVSISIVVDPIASAQEMAAAASLAAQSRHIITELLTEVERLHKQRDLTVDIIKVLAEGR